MLRYYSQSIAAGVLLDACSAVVRIPQKSKLQKKELMASRQPDTPLSIATANTSSLNEPRFLGAIFLACYTTAATQESTPHDHRR